LRIALALETRASLLQAVEIPAMDTAMDGGPQSTTGCSSSDGVEVPAGTDDTSALLTDPA
jgi:hypothetical protein